MATPEPSAATQPSEEQRMLGVLANRAPVDAASAVSASQIVDFRFHKLQARRQLVASFPRWRRWVTELVVDRPWFNLRSRGCSSSKLFS